MNINNDILAKNSEKKKIVIAYWSSRNLGVLDNIINSFMEADFEVKELQFNYLQNLSINKYLRVRSNTNILNLFYLLYLGLKLNFFMLFNENIYLFGTNIPLFCPMFIKRKGLVCHYNEVPKFFENSDSLFSKYEKFLFKSALQIVASNSFRKELFEKINTKADYYILDNILSYKFYLEEEIPYNKSGNPIKLLYSGIISKNREIAKIINSVKKNHKFELKLIGDIETTYAKLFFDEIESAGNINYLGKVSFEMAMDLTRETDFGIAIYNLQDKNNYYCAPVKIHEYFHFRKPVISLENPPLMRIAREYHIIYPLKEIDDLQYDKVAEEIRKISLKSDDFTDFEKISLKDFRSSIHELITTVFQ
jgi:hypothetical protein